MKLHRRTSSKPSRGRVRDTASMAMHRWLQPLTMWVRHHPVAAIMIAAASWVGNAYSLIDTLWGADPLIPVLSNVATAILPRVSNNVALGVWAFTGLLATAAVVYVLVTVRGRPLGIGSAGERRPVLSGELPAHPAVPTRWSALSHVAGGWSDD